MRSYVNRERASADDPKCAQYLLSRSDLYDLIRQHADGHDLVAEIATRLPLDRDGIVTAVTSKAPWPDKAYSAPTRPGPRRVRILSEYEPYIDQLLAEDPYLMVWEIRDRLLDEHHVDASYGIVRDYIARNYHTENCSAGQVN